MENFDFSSVDNADTETPAVGVFGSYDRVFGTGPWSVSASGVDLSGDALLTDIGAPSAVIGDGLTGDATVGALVAADVGGGVIGMGSASVYQNNIGATFVEGWTYTLTADLTSADILSVDLLSDAGVGIGLRSGGSTIYADGSDSLLDLGIFDAGTTSITYTFTAGFAEAGENIGIDLYVGHATGVLTAGVLGAVSFDNIVVTAVPEPSTSALLIGLLGLSYVGFKRSKRS
ncbi:PEP-CTERM sorting domain-containing protein [Coraliomargarita sp. SDUM461003]|uniref:PEP-CTERM sorting domain-containing protein n=1 Tax=Thalassobacterium maritimum TaxID=3041265 RepID=A0ABU1AVF0_9BACT|nr:PEP-CTERM sorting domain-containing protein [Coraliomargarita sp. SDUM461003]MDQ8208053.1 PEP-CTERM sorting domain-containing protein [Coraliomargarita sp. SDUM461003]